MAKYPDKDEWVEEILIVDTSTPVLGGQPVWEGDRLVDGFSNISSAMLADRTRHLKNKIETLEQDVNQDFSSFVRKDNNLSDLQDIQQAKFNLGLNLVDNTRDLDKPVSDATQEALDAKANKAGDTFTGEVVAPGFTATSAVPQYRFNDTSGVAGQKYARAIWDAGTFFIQKMTDVGEWEKDLFRILSGDQAKIGAHDIWHDGNKATQTQALEGTADNVGMTPLRVFQAFQQFGLGTTSQQFPGNNMNVTDNSVPSGFYKFDASTTGAPAAINGNVIHMRRTAGGGEMQIALVDGGVTQGTMYYRVRQAASWLPWRTSWDSANTTPDNNGILHSGSTIPAGKQSVTEDRSIVAGTGLSGGGTLEADRTLSVNFGTTAGTVKEGTWQPATATKAQVLDGTSTTDFVSADSYSKIISWEDLGTYTSGLITIDLLVSLNFVMEVGGDVTIEDPQNVMPGKCGEIVVNMTATGSVSWGTNWKFLGSVPDIGENGEMWVISYKVLSATETIASANKVA